ncbi:cysteine hydrolase family protein [Pseudorhodoferax sp.]|uniref:cysteine hydrolase family protein n=1 Tax=Pseudorhodoferax sp. TaxID=1993553 RepID=UPI0039E652F0
MLIVIDMQKDNVDVGAPMFFPQARAAIEPNRRALELARAAAMLVVFAMHAHRADGRDMGRFADRYPAIRERRALIEGTPGAEICDELRPNADELVIKKRRHSTFFGTDLDIVLRSQRIDTVVIAGLATSSCVISTARDACAHEYRTVVLGDACVAGSVADRGWGAWDGDQITAAGLSVMAGNTAEVLTVEQFAALLRRA